jgi:hypothetical protein
MRKLLLSSTALATAAALTSGAAVAEFAVSGYSEFTMQQQKSRIAARKGSYNGQDAELKFTATKKLDNGMGLSYVMDFDADAGSVDENYMSISTADFGTLVLGQNDPVSDNFGIQAADLVSEEAALAPLSHSIGTNSDIALGANDNNKVTYMSPAGLFGGLQVGVSMEDTGTSAAASTTTDITTFGGRYTTEVAGNAVSIGLLQASQDSAAASQNNKSTAGGIKVTRGNISVATSKSTFSGSDEDRSAIGYGLSYNMGGGLVLSGYADNVQDSLDAGEKYSASSLEAAYEITSGLTAVIGHTMFDYKAGTNQDATVTTTNGALNDSGSITKLTVKASF